MTVTITLHIFSGRADPSWELSDAQIRELADRIKKISKTTLLKPIGVTGLLGYRGFSVVAVREKSLDPHIYIHDGIVDLDRFNINLIEDNHDLEAWLLSTAGLTVPDDVVKVVQSEFSRSVWKGLSTPFSPFSVPPFDPGKWNNDPNIRQHNNCYNYANDKITNTFAQPGLGSGVMYTAFDCGNVGSASQRDGQSQVGPPSTTPAQGHFIALVIWAGYDFHWYRQDNNDKWSHKPGQSPARNVDNSGHLIGDPRTCDRGPYVNFCSFYHCIPATTRIR
ncbi:hypothetical protein [Trinickia sp. EG282A]|uniref:hypothetical protein n=1 Tax=Trinickia sp. EG282A TaxID=3237013 RepID=UPI0034D27BFE